MAAMGNRGTPWGAAIGCALDHMPAGYTSGMTESPLPPAPDADADDEIDQDSEPSTMAPPGEGPDQQGMAD
jgi:hypothetical protein